MPNSTLNIVEQFALRCMHVYLGDDKYAAKIGGYLCEEVKRGRYADVEKIESYIGELGGYKNRWAGEAFLLAAALPYDDILMHFLVGGVDPNYHDAVGRTALMISAYEGYSQNVKFIHVFGGRIGQKDNDGSHALVYAFNSKRACLNLDAINYLIDKGADLHLMNRYGVTLDTLVRDNSGLSDLLAGARKKREVRSLENNQNALSLA